MLRNNRDMGGERFAIFHILLWIWTGGRIWGGGVCSPLALYSDLLLSHWMPWNRPLKSGDPNG